MAQAEEQNRVDTSAQMLTRRSFLKRTLASSAGAMLVAGCTPQPSTSSSSTPHPTGIAPITLKWTSEWGYKGDTTTFKFLKDKFNHLNRQKISVDHFQGKGHDAQYDSLRQMLNNHQADYD